MIWRRISCNRCGMFMWVSQPMIDDATKDVANRMRAGHVQYAADMGLTGNHNQFTIGAATETGDEFPPTHQRN